MAGDQSAILRIQAQVSRNPAPAMRALTFQSEPQKTQHPVETNIMLLDYVIDNRVRWQTVDMLRYDRIQRQVNCIST